MKILAAIKFGSLDDIKAEIENIKAVAKKYSNNSLNTNGIPRLNLTNMGYDPSWTLMHLAAERKYQSKQEALAIFQYLQEVGFDLNAITFNDDNDAYVHCLQETPLIIAVQALSSDENSRTEQDYYAIDALIELGANVNKGYTAGGKSLFYNALATLDLTLAKKLANAGANPFKKDARGWRPGYEYDKRLAVYDLDKERVAIILETEAIAKQKGMQDCTYNEGAEPEPSILATYNETSIEKLKELLTKAIVCDENTQTGFRNIRSERSDYQSHPLSLPMTYNELLQHQNELAYIEIKAKDRRPIREIMRQVIRELGTNPNASGGISAYDVVFGEDTFVGKYAIEFIIRSDYIADMRENQKVKNPGYASMTDKLVGAFNKYGVTPLADVATDTGILSKQIASNFVENLKTNPFMFFVKSDESAAEVINNTENPEEDILNLPNIKK